jgi:hypothetical protein
MFIISSYDLFYIIIIFLLLVKITNTEHEKSNIYYLFNNYKPIRHLYDKNTLYELYQESHIKYFEKKEISKENFHIILESIVAEMIINLFQEKITSNDSFIKVHIKTKIHLLLQNYKFLYDFNNYENFLYILNISLINRIIDILSETEVDIFNIYNSISKFLKNEGLYYQEFESYITNRNKNDLNYENLSFKKENLIKYSGEFINNNLKFSKWMYSPETNIIN